MSRLNALKSVLPSAVISGWETDGTDAAPQPPAPLPTPANALPARVSKVEASLFAACMCGAHHRCAGAFASPTGSETHACTCACHGDANPVQDLIAAATTAARSIDRFVQLHDPRGSDLRALENLRTALAAFGALT